MADKPVDEIVDLDAVLDALPDSPTASDVYEATLPFSNAAVAAVAAKRALAGGGGGALPNPITTPVSIATTDVDAVALSVQFPDGMNANPVEVRTADGPSVAAYTDNTTAALYVGGGSSGSASVSADATDASVSVSRDDGTRQATLSSDAASSLVYVALAGVAPFQVNKDGYLILNHPTAIADADLSQGQLAFWFDADDGTTRLMLKGKTAGGAVKTAEIPLT